MQKQVPDRKSPLAEGISPDVVAVLAGEHARFLAFLERRVASREQAEKILHEAFVRAPLCQVGHESAPSHDGR
jgi:hypothetical protein